MEAAQAGKSHITLPGITQWIEKRPVDTARICPDLAFSLTQFALQALHKQTSEGNALSGDHLTSDYQYYYPDLGKGQTLADFLSPSEYLAL